MNASVIGGGSWGSAFALYLGRLGHRTKLWVREPEICAAMVERRENPVFLPGFTFPEDVSFHHGIEAAMAGADILFVAVPSVYCRKVYARLAPHLEPHQAIVSLTKGLEKRTLMRISQVLREECGSSRHPNVGVLSGPSFSREVAERHPTALVLASDEAAWAKRVQHFISGPNLRVYTSHDVIGVELAGALKNIIAIAAGLSDAMDFGYNSRAALMTRGLAEIARLGLKLGAHRDTFAGLAGMGDLLLTCTGPLSRNRNVGFELGRGRRLRDIISHMRMVAEGLPTTVSAHELARRENVDMPIVEQVYQVLYRGKDPRKALADLMSRTLKEE
jgi:glycerol-3-phosphate dehydrogenase (NAD(P)+)